MTAVARALGCVALGCAAGWLAARALQQGQGTAPVEQPGALDWARERASRPYDWSTHQPTDFDCTPWPQLAWQARFDEILHGPEGDVEDAFLGMVTGWCRDDSGSAE